jgi:hypothetical protein
MDPFVENTGGRLSIPPYRKTRPKPRQKHRKAQSKGFLKFPEKIMNGVPHPQEKDFPGQEKNFKTGEFMENRSHKMVPPTHHELSGDIQGRRTRMCEREQMGAPAMPLDPALSTVPPGRPCSWVGCPAPGRCAPILNISIRPDKMSERSLEANRITQNLEAWCSAPRSYGPSRIDPGPH